MNMPVSLERRKAHGETQREVLAFLKSADGGVDREQIEGRIGVSVDNTLASLLKRGCIRVEMAPNLDAGERYARVIVAYYFFVADLPESKLSDERRAYFRAYNAARKRLRDGA